MPEIIVQYVVVALIVTIGVIVQAYLTFRGRRDTSGDGELLDRAAYYASMQDRNEKLQTRNDLLEEGKRLQNQQLQKADEEIFELKLANTQLTHLKDEQAQQVEDLRAELRLRSKDAEGLQQDIAALKRRVRELEVRGTPAT